MTTPTLNVEHLDKVLNLIDTQPEKWCQGSWVDGNIENAEKRAAYKAGKVEMCGTTACVAGWAVMLHEDYRPVAMGDVADIGQFYTDNAEFLIFGVVSKARWAERDKYPIKKAEVETLDHFFTEHGRTVLGLDEDQATDIFVNLDYDDRRPHTFTDTVRHYLGLPVKWGTVIEGAPGDYQPDVIQNAEDER